MGFTVRNLNGTPYSVRQKGSSVVIHGESTVIILVKALLYPKFDYQDNFMFHAVCGCGQTRAIFFPGISLSIRLCKQIEYGVWIISKNHNQPYVDFLGRFFNINIPEFCLYTLHLLFLRNAKTVSPIFNLKGDKRW